MWPFGMDPKFEEKGKEEKKEHKGNSEDAWKTGSLAPE